MGPPNPLEDLLRERIAREGPLSFREVMQAALYHPEYGYYTNLRGFGADGDFITSPERHPAFGWLLGRQALDVWEAVGRPRPFRILELGAGAGALAESLVGCLRGAEGGPTELEYIIEEVSPSLRAVQRERLTDAAFTWVDTETQADFVVANEVADALPINRAVVRGGVFHELLVNLDAGGRLTWLESEQPSRAVADYFAALHYTPPEGQVVDVCLDLPRWVESVAERMNPRSVALIMDYAASPPRDTLLTYFRHTMGSDPLVRLGQQDISAHVDMRTLVRAAIAHGLKAGAVAQRGLLLNLGFEQVHAQLSNPTNRRALADLVDPNGPGGQIAAVFLVRGLPDYRPVGAVGGRSWPPARGVPSLDPDRDEREFMSQWREAFASSYEEA